jgi:hypothetical protein
MTVVSLSHCITSSRTGYFVEKRSLIPCVSDSWPRPTPEGGLVPSLTHDRLIPDPWSPHPYLPGMMTRPTVTEGAIDANGTHPHDPFVKKIRWPGRSECRHPVRTWAGGAKVKRGRRKEEGGRKSSASWGNHGDIRRKKD